MIDPITKLFYDPKTRKVSNCWHSSLQRDLDEKIMVESHCCDQHAFAGETIESVQSGMFFRLKIFLPKTFWDSDEQFLKI